MQIPVLILLLVVCAPALGDVTYIVNGVDDTLKENVLSHVDTIQFGPQVRLSDRDIESVLDKAVANAHRALRPFGYYAPDIKVQANERDAAQTVVEINIATGPPVIISDADISVVGPGAGEQQFQIWRRLWPLNEGDALNQIAWEQQKLQAIEIANDRGYLGATLAEHTLEIDLENNTSNIRLVLDTGPRYVMGDVKFGEHVLKPGILEYVPRFDKGDPYTARLVSYLRTDLWKTGYFTDVQVVELERTELSPPVVDLDVQVETLRRNSYQGALGYGTGTGVRLQANWSRHPLSSYGDRIDVGIGWQELDDEFTLRGRHRLPRRNRVREWWDTELTLKYENLDLEFKQSEEDKEYVRVANGSLDERHLRFGRLKLRNFKSGESQIFDTLFLQYLSSQRRFEILGMQPELMALLGTPVFDHLLRGTDTALSIGVDVDLIDVDGRSFNAVGRRDRAWLFTSNKAFGSEIEFTQLYLSSRRSYRVADNLKFHLRAEVGYTDADVDEFSIDTPDSALDLSVTRLPYFYRFKAGGSMSVRGYGFEQLSNNDVGSNNIITASAEAEYRFLNSWSAALFVDIGNAFNDWSEASLKRGVGVGIRWYSIVGEIRVDMAKALDFNGDPWRLHITIGTPLL